MTRILVTGATGFIGRNLTIALIDEGHEVAACDCREPLEYQTGLRFSQINLLDTVGLADFMANFRPEVVFHLGARTDLLGRSVADYSANIEGVQNVIQVCESTSSVRRVIFASSRMVCRIDHIPSSYSEYSPPNYYGESKMQGEALVRSAQVPFEWVIVRPTSIWGPGFGIPYRNFFDQVKARRYFHQRGHNPNKSFGFVGNTVFQLISLSKAPSDIINGRTFYLGDYEPVALREWANYIHRSFGLPGKIPTVPMSAMWLAAKVGDCINLFRNGDCAPLTTFRLRNLVADMVYPQLNELKVVTGELPYSWQQGTDVTVRWMQQSGAID